MFVSNQSSSQCFLTFRWSVLCFSLCSLPLVLSLDTIEKSLDPPSFHILCEYLFTLIRSPHEHSLLQTEQFTTSVFSHMWDVSVSLSFLWTIFGMSMSLFCWGSLGLDTICQVRPHQCWIERQVHSSWPAGNAPAVFWNNRLSTARAHFWLLFNLVSNRALSTAFQMWESSRVGVDPNTW